MPTKWLQERAKGSKNEHEMPPHRAFCDDLGQTFQPPQGAGAGFNEQGGVATLWFFFLFITLKPRVK